MITLQVFLMLLPFKQIFVAISCDFISVYKKHRESKQLHKQVSNIQA